MEANMHDSQRRSVVLALDMLHSADDCRHCGKPKDGHTVPFAYCIGLGGSPDDIGEPERFTPIGWNNKTALGLSIGCYWDYGDQRCHFFDIHNLEETMQGFVETQPLLVSFNGRSFDFPLMRGLLRLRAEDMLDEDIQDCTDEPPGSALASTKRQSAGLIALCDSFKIQCSSSYDLLAEIWQVDPSRRFEHGLNSLDAISRANGLGGKLSHGAEAPRRWARGEYAHVLNYCQDDVLKTKALFEMVCAGHTILRGDDQPIMLRNPLTQEEPHAPAQP